ncbi:MAG: transaldolase [Rhodospirillales bacterium]
MTDISKLNIKIFADGADLEQISALGADPLIKGFTTNPTLMRKAGVGDYRSFANEALKIVSPRPICFEVLSDNLDGMETQARLIASWGDNVYVKIPITNTQGLSTQPIIRRLSADGVKLNVTALMTLEQVEAAVSGLSSGTPAYISVFAGRIADTGRDPSPVIAEALKVLEQRPNGELIWSSPRELLNIFTADHVGCHIITVTHDILAKLSRIGMDLGELSLETIRMFERDARQAGYELE